MQRFGVGSIAAQQISCNLERLGTEGLEREEITDDALYVWLRTAGFGLVNEEPKDSKQERCDEKYDMEEI